MRPFPKLLCFLVSTSLMLSTSSFSTVATATTPLSSDTEMVLLKTIFGNISPKSVTSSGSGIISAQNMMYRHSVTIYDSRTLKLKSTIPDTVSLSTYGFSKNKGLFKGAPVEGAYSPDGNYLYVTNYSMYGKGYNHEGHDLCSPASHYDTSFTYRINLHTRKTDEIYSVGAVPKGIAVTANNKYIVVSNWCSYSLSIIDIALHKTIKTINVGAYPRGISISSDSNHAYIAEMGGNRIHVLNLIDFSMSYIPIGVNPRAIVLSPDGKYLYASLNQSGRVAAWNLQKNRPGVVVQTGKDARSLAISADGSALFVTNYLSGTVSKIRTKDMTLLQTIKVCKSPIGITYDAPTARTWVACYEGLIKVYDNK